MDYDQQSPSNEFLTLFSYAPTYLVQPRTKNNSKTPTGNIYSNVNTPNNILSKFIATISDHLPQFLITPYSFSKPPSTKLKIFEKDRFKFDQDNFFS